jgi:EAL domain-containing protein (putative c-di-GMP-specific phosphodiesterase class I)
LVAPDDLDVLVTDGAAVLTRHVSDFDGRRAGQMVSATVGLRGSSTIALVIEVEPSMTYQRRLLREMLSLTVEVAPAIEQLLDASQPKEALAELTATVESIIDDGRHRAVFQPIHDIETGQVVGYEALTRFDDGVRPDIRFEHARRVGLGARLELATLRSAITASAALPSGRYLSINVSATLLGHDDLPLVLDVAAERQLTIEITEHEQIDDYDLVRSQFAGLGRSLHVAVDDAGSGWASLHHVFSLRPHYVKLDRSWIADLQTDPARQALLLGIARSVREMGGHVIAEGIEHQAELETVRATGIRFGQGYLLGHPMDVADLPST